MSFEARNALMLAKKVVDEAAKFKKAIQKAGGGAAKAKVIPYGEPQRQKNLAAFNPVLDETGKPKVFYHNTNRDFSVFNTKESELGAHFGTPNQAANLLANQENPFASRRTMAVHLNLNNPLRLVDEGDFSVQRIAQQLYDKGMIDEKKYEKHMDGNFRSEEAAIKDLQSVIQKAGHDGIVYLNRREGLEHHPDPQIDKQKLMWHFAMGLRATDPEFKEKFPEAEDSFIVFEPHQIKSATGNQGTFDPTNPDITKAEGGAAKSKVIPHGDKEREDNLATFLKGNHPEVPRVMYHGTDRGMTGIFEGARGVAAHLAFDPETATKYAEQHDVPKINYTYFNKLGPQIYPVHVSAKNVFDARKEKHVRMIGGHPSQNWDWQDLEKSIPAMKKAGFDSYFDFEHGIQGFKSGAEPTGLAVFEPHQIKSATGNQGTFNPTDPDITKAGGGEVARKTNKIGLYSKAAEQARQLPSGSVPAAQLIGTLRNKGGIKAEELANAGITDQAGNLSPEWQSKGKIAPEDLAAHFEQHLPEIEETVLGKTIKGTPYPEEYTKIEQSILAKYKPDLERLHQINIDPSHDRETRNKALDEKEALQEKMWSEIDAAIPDRDRHVEASRDKITPTKYHDYTLPGGEDYQEILLRLPNEKKQRVGVTSTGHIFTEEELSDPIVRRTAEKIGLTMEDRMMPTREPLFKSSHWDDPDVVAHIRWTKRRGPNGEKILHVEEVQSDWGQKGKKDGFADPLAQQKLKEMVDKFYKLEMERKIIQDKINEYHSKNELSPKGLIERHFDITKERTNLIDQMDNIKSNARKNIPSAPYVTSTQGWTDLALKRILKEAAEGGYDKVVWTPGAEQAKRYDLSKQISKLEYDPQDKTLNYTTNEGVFVRHPDYVEPNQLPNVIGKEATEKLLAQEKHKITGRQTLSTSDLQIGGEGMKDYYDNILPKRLQAVAQKHDKTAKISQSLIKTHGDEWPFSARIAHDGENYWVAGQSPSVSTSAEQQLSPKFKSYEEASNHRDLLYQGFNQPVSALNITPQMRDSILKGQEGYARGGDVNRQELRTGGSPDLDIVRQALEQVADPLSQNPELAQKAVDIAAQAYKVPTGNITAGSSYYGHKGPMDVSNIQTTLEPLPGVTPLKKKPMSWEDFYKIGKGGTMINLGGDRSRLGRLTHINNKKLAWPVDLHAGPEYMLEPNPEAVWANALGHTTGLKKKIIQASDRGPVYGVYTPMGPKTVDSSFQMFDALLSQIAADPPSKKAATQFDEAMKKGLYVMGSTDKAQKDRVKEIEKMENWPGILNTLEAREHAKGLPGSTRSLIVKYLDRASWNKLGFPHVGVTRAAITNPDLLAAPSNMMGHRIVELSPKDIEETAFKHNTYASPTAGKYVGDVPLVQRQYAMPDVTENFLSRRVGQKQDVIMHPYSLQSSGRDAARKMFEEQKQSQIVGQKMLDSIQKGLEKQKHYGLARGGDVMHTRKVFKPHTPVVGERQHKTRHPAMMIPGIHVVGAIHGIPYFTGKK